MPTSLVNGLGGNAGFGENFLNRNDDGSTGLIDLRSVFGTTGINFFGTVYTALYVNNNGSVSFSSPIGQYTPTTITGVTSNPQIAAYWADVDTRGGQVTATPGGTSTGSNLVWYDLDPTTRTFTATWDDVGYYNSRTNRLNAFQISLTQVGTVGDFDVTFRYEAMSWTTGGASGGVDGLGGTIARAGYTSGNGVNFLELPQSGNQASMLGLTGASNVGTPGTYSFSIRNGAVTPTFSALDTATTEGNGGTVRFAMVPVVLSAASSTSVSVQYATVDGSALAGQDYVAQRGILTFAPGVTSQNVFIELVGDTTPEQDENFILRLSGASGAPISSSDARVTIVNDDGLTISDVQRLEGTSTTPTTFAFTVTLLSAATAPVTVNWATQAGTAVAATDFTPASGTLTFAAGETQKTINVSVAADTTVEADETFSVVLSGASGAAIANGTGTATILNDDGFSIDDLTVVEGTDGTTQNALVTIRLLGVATAPVSVNWTATPGTATAPADFTAASGTVTFAVGETTKTVAIPIVRDSVVEGTETLTVRLSGATGTTIVRDTATVTIIDDDGFSVADAAVNEGNSGTTSLGFTVSLGSALAMGSTVAYAVTGGTATAGTDFTAASGTLTFAPGVTTQTVNVAVIGDVTFEADETLALTLSNPNGTGLSRAVATGTIFNDDGFRVGSATVTEGNSGTVNVVVPVTLGSAATGSVTVRWATADGTATAGEDYTAASGTLTFAPGTVSQNVTVAVRGDTLFEPNETFRIVLSDPVGTGIVVGSGTVTITNDDVRPPPSLRIVDAAISEGTGSGTTLLRFLVTLSEASTSAVTVNFATTPGTATAGTDYTTASGTLTIPAGNLFGFVEVPVIRDAVLEADETLTVTLSGATGGATIAIATAVGTILNDDVIIGTDGADSLNGTAGADAILGGLGNDTLAGGDGDDSLDGGGGDDSLSGGAGADTMAGSAGNDVFLVNDASDLVLEVAGGGADTIITSLAMSSREHVEALRIADGVSGITLTGSAGNDILVSNGLANRLDGGAGDDVILVGNVSIADIHALFAA